MERLDFDRTFQDLTGHPPFPWQRELYRRFIDGDFPPSCDLPTGLGKTSVIPIWLIALAVAPDKVPRRLVYVVNRRTVVDQATAEAEKLRNRLVGELGPRPKSIWVLATEVAKLCAVETDMPLAISTLRGQFADNREWSRDPARPAVIVGTVDMIGSRLLFSGYGCGFKTRPLHAGFLGQDALLVHDEAHLEKPFQDLIEAIRDEQERERSALTGRNLRVVALTATSRGGTNTFSLTDADREHPVVRQRVNARKRLDFHPIAEPKKVAAKIAELAYRRGQEQPDSRIIVFVRTVEAVNEVRGLLRKKDVPEENVLSLTGTMRGLERDGLVRKPLFQLFMPSSKRSEGAEQIEGTIYLVCTSAGEVGVDISADHLVCDLTPYDSMAQRFGRVNRFGDGDARIDVVHTKDLPSEADIATERKKDKQKQKGAVFFDGSCRRTLELLHELNGDASPAALGWLDPNRREAAFSPTPESLPTSDVLFDAWALTTIRGKLPGRPPVEPYLHGIGGWEPPETHVAWREEVEVVVGLLLERYKPEDLLDDYPLKPHELLRDRSDRVFDRLKKLKAPGDTPVWVVLDDGLVQPTTLEDLIGAGKDDLSKRTLLLPPSAGGLADGMFVGNAPAANAMDVADDWCDEHNAKLRNRQVWDDDEPPEKMRLIRTIDTDPDAGDENGSGDGRFWHWYEMPKAGDTDWSRSSEQSVELNVHTKDVANNAKPIVGRLPLSNDMKRAITLAAEWHDLGKRRSAFQRILGNPNLDLLLAKSGKKQRKFGIPERYRHEFGSLIDVLDQTQPHHAEYRKLSEEMKDMVLHLIAVHHGFGRPHFPSDHVLDPEPKGQDVIAIATEIPRRFARLQRKYGRWGLAYLESLLRAADYAASAKPSKFVEGDS